MIISAIMEILHFSKFSKIQITMYIRCFTGSYLDIKTHISRAGLIFELFAVFVFIFGKLYPLCCGGLFCQNMGQNDGYEWGFGLKSRILRQKNRKKRAARGFDLASSGNVAGSHTATP